MSIECVLFFYLRGVIPGDDEYFGASGEHSSSRHGNFDERHAWDEKLVPVVVVLSSGVYAQCGWNWDWGQTMDNGHDTHSAI